MPTSLVNTTLDFRNDLLDEATHVDRNGERRAYQMRQKARPDAYGHAGMHWPASTPAPLVRCELKPGSEGPATKSKVRILVTDVLASQNPKILLPGVVTPPPAAGAKFAQILPHRTPEWHAHYDTLRNSIEGMNGFIKDGAREAIDDHERRRIVRGQISVPAFGHEKSPPLRADVLF